MGVPQASALRLSVDGQRTQVVLELNRPVAFRTVIVPDPPRLMVDLPEVDWRLRPGAIARPRGLVTGERHGLFSPGRSRLVLSLAAPFRIVQQTLLPPASPGQNYRLVLDLESPFPLQPPPVQVAEPAPDPVPQHAAPLTAPVPLARPFELPPAPAEAVPVPPVQSVPTVTVIMAAAAVGAAPAPDAAVASGRTEVAAVVPTPTPLPQHPPSDLPMVVIDPGHGGVDPGTVGVDGELEKDIVLAMARALRDLLLGTGHYRVALTRDDDSFLRLRERIAKAREAGGEVFISLHADSLNLASQRGASVYTLSETATDAEAGRLASKENKSDILAGTDLSHHDAVVTSILIDLAQRETNNRSIAFAELVADELGRASPFAHPRQRSAGFAVLKSPDIPSVLIELGYLSNPEDAHNLSLPGYRAALAGAVLRALDRQFGQPRS